MKNVKLVATDMDGTLLTSKKEMPEEAIPLIEQLMDKGIMFAVSSGRFYHNLLKIYDKIANDIIVVAENGALVMDKGEIVYSSVISSGDVREIVREVRKIPGTKITLCGLHAGYLFANEMDEMMEEMAHNYFIQHKVIETLDDIPHDEQILKFAIFDESHRAFETIHDGLAHLSHKYQVAVSGAEWADITNVGVNKGVAIKALQEKYGITYEETMVFGDQQNDYEMMQQAHYSYAMANGVDQIKNISNFEAPSNDDHGVLKILEKLLAVHA